VVPAVADLTDTFSPTALAATAGAGILLSLVLLLVLVTQLRRLRRSRAETTSARGHLATVTATMREGVVAYDLQHRLTFVNPAFERLTGYPAEDLQDQEFLQYVHPDDRPALIAEWDRLAQGGSLRDQEYRVVRRGGQIRWSSSTWEPLKDESGRQIGYLGTEFDITERKLAEAEMRIDTELFQAVIEVQQAVAAAGLDSQTVRHVIAERSQRLTGASGAVIEAVEGNEVVPQVSLGTEAPRLPLSGSLSGLAIRTGEVQRSDDAWNDPRIEHERYRELGVRSLLVAPLRDEHRTIGALKVVSPEPNAFTDRDAKALRLLGGLMGAALGHAAAYEARQARLEDRTQSLQDSEQRFKQLVDAAQEGIWVADERGTMTYVNQRMSELLGHPNGALLGRPVYEFLDPASRPAAQRALSQPVAGGKSLDLRFKRKDGGELWGLVSTSPVVRRDGVAVGTVGMVTDITERKRAEDRLRRSADRLGMLHDLDQAILAARSPAEVGRAALGRIRRMVPCQRCTVVLFDTTRGQAQVLAGFAGAAALSATTMPLETLSPGDVLRRATVRTTDDLTALEDPPPIFRQLMADGIRSVLSVPLLVDGEAIGEINLASATPAGFDAEHREIALEIATPLAIAIQHARLRDELARRTAELERRVAERGAALRTATAELDSVLYSVSHDLRSPMRHIGGFAQLLLEDGGPGLDPAAQHYARRISEGAARLAAMVDDLVQFSRVSRQDMMRREVNLNTLVEDLVGHFQAEAAVEGRVLDWQVGELPTIEGDPALMRIAVEQLLANAVKFTRPRERAAIRIRPVRSEEQDGLAVEDNGVGFRMAYAGKLFGLFQRLHRAEEFEGNGAGLALVQRIAQRHGGRVWAESELDQGATFYVTFGGTPDRRRRETAPTPEPAPTDELRPAEPPAVRPRRPATPSA
jgi:PAS domain S-box-containing protein